MELKMPLKGPKPEDVTKLHNEINQLLNQRFILTTLALTLFGVLTAWMIPKDAGTENVAFPFAISIVISTLLLAIYAWSDQIRLSARALSSYLEETGNSNWETDWREFIRVRGFWSQTKQQTVIFLLLMTINVISPYVVLVLLSTYVVLVLLSTFTPSFLAGVSSTWGAVLGAAIYGIGFHNLFDRENNIEQTWKKLNSHSK